MKKKEKTNMLERDLKNNKYFILKITIAVVSKSKYIVGREYLEES